ncbi:MAG: hypothetical protein DCC71_21060 [Proteobacteria bacterium]|nr:MAG: hypothetical protein DCC71_21060 [Pseudomonadota bacterium]
MHVGFFDQSDPANERLILRILPNGDDEWRFRMAANTSQGERLGSASFDSVPLTWSLDWEPSGDGDRTGTLTGSVSDGITTLELPAPIVPANEATLDAFGVWANSASSSEPARSARSRCWRSAPSRRAADRARGSLPPFAQEGRWSEPRRRRCWRGSGRCCSAPTIRSRRTSRSR